VADIGAGVTTGLLAQLHGFVELVLAQVDQRQLGTLSGQKSCHATAQTLSAAGDGDYCIFEIHTDPSLRLTRVGKPGVVQGLAQGWGPPSPVCTMVERAGIMAAIPILYQAVGHSNHPPLIPVGAGVNRSIPTRDVHALYVFVVHRLAHHRACPADPGRRCDRRAAHRCPGGGNGHCRYLPASPAGRAYPVSYQPTLGSRGGTCPRNARGRDFGRRRRVPVSTGDHYRHPGAALYPAGHSGAADPIPGQASSGVALWTAAGPIFSAARSDRPHPSSRTTAAAARSV